MTIYQGLLEVNSVCICDIEKSEIYYEYVIHGQMSFLTILLHNFYVLTAVNNPQNFSKSILKEGGKEEGGRFFFFTIMISLWSVK